MRSFLLSFACALCLSLLAAKSAAQNVGIGTNNPKAKLEVSGSVAITPSLYTPGASISLNQSVSTATISSNAPTTGDANVVTVGFTPTEGQLLYIMNADNDTGIFSPTIDSLAPGSVSSFIYLNGGWENTGGASGLVPQWQLRGNAGTNPAVHYAGTSDGQDFILKSNAAERIRLLSTGQIDITGDLVNQEMIGSYTPCTTTTGATGATYVTAAGGATSASLGLPTTAGGTVDVANQQGLCQYNDINCAVVINNTTQSITISSLDGNGTSNSAVLVVASVSLRTLATATLPNSMRFSVWLQRSTDNFVTDIQNLFRVMGANGSGLPVSSPYNMASGNTAVPIVYADANLTAGTTYTYRLVFQGGNFGTGAGTVNWQALDRSMTLLQIKR